MTDQVRGPGRPTSYDPSYCDLVIEDAREGYSLSAFAGGIMVSRQTITDWRKAHPDFDDACATAKVVRARFLETGMMKEDIPAPAMNARKFALVNCAEEDWRDQSTLKHVGGDPATDQPIQVSRIELVAGTREKNDSQPSKDNNMVRCAMGPYVRRADVTSAIGLEK